ncbi:hypothetical protein SDC9_103516 [bioreactor metagenome]|uniref:Uncharacterized protein n=1 Tax=bioreactor metagenome TaxID=1076179 RepID=A0A645ATX2_9ZZZZ
MEILGYRVGVDILERRFKNLHLIIVAVDEYDYRTVGLALELHRVESREFEEWREIAAGVAVIGLPGGGGEEHRITFSRAGILRDAAEGAAGDDDLVLGIVPLRLFIYRVPQQLKPKAAAAGEFFDHILGDGALFKFIIAVLVAEADVKSLF